MRDRGPRVALAGVAVFLMAACSSGGAGRPPLPPAPHPTAEGPVVSGIKRAGVLRVASDLSYPPLAFLDRGAAQGFEIDLASLLAAALGVRLEVIDTPRAAARVSFADADLLISEWDAEGAPGPASTPYYIMRQAILWREKETPTSDGSLRNARVAVQARSRGQAVAERLGATPAVVEYLPLEALGAVARGTVQAAVVDLPLVAEYARTHPRLRMSTGSWGDVPLVVVVRPNAADLLAFTSAVIQELDRRGGLAQLRRRWQL